MALTSHRSFTSAVAVVAFLAGSACGLAGGSTEAGQAAQAIRRYFTPRVPGDPAVTPFSGAVQVGETLYLSGTLGLGPNRELPATAEEEATNVLNAIQATLKEAGMTMDDLVNIQVFSPNATNYDAFNTVYRTYFTQEFPARSFVGSGTLLFDARFEVLGVAVKR